jgi:hypothetical protein
MALDVLVFLAGFALGMTLKRRKDKLQVGGVIVAVLLLTLPFYIHDHGGFHRYTVYERHGAVRDGIARLPRTVPYRDRCEVIKDTFDVIQSKTWKCPNYPWPIAGK